MTLVRNQLKETEESLRKRESEIESMHQKVLDAEATLQRERKELEARLSEIEQEYHFKEKSLTDKLKKDMHSLV